MKVMEVNMHGVFYGTKHGIALMRESKTQGSIINMSSVVGQVGVPGCVAYGATKGGVRLMSKTVAVETAADKIRVNTIHPGMIMTNIQQRRLKKTRRIMTRWCRPFRWVNLASLLMSLIARCF